MGFDFIVIMPLLPSHSGFSFVFLWMWGIFFGEFQCLPLDDCSAVSCDSGALVRGSERTSFYSAILNQVTRVQFFAKMDPTTEVCGCMSTLIVGWHPLPF